MTRQDPPIKYVYTDIDRMRFLACSPATDRLSLGSQGHSVGADSYVHVGIILLNACIGV